MRGVYVLRLLKQSQIVKADYIAQGLESRREED